MAAGDDDYDEILYASERFRSANEDMAWYLLSGNNHEATRDKLWQQMEKAREELWALRSQRMPQARPKNGNPPE